MTNVTATILAAHAPLTLRPRICLVAWTGEADGLQRTLQALESAGCQAQCSLLASNDAALHKVAADFSLQGSFDLPEVPSTARYWTEMLKRSGFDGQPTLFLRAGCILPVAGVERLAAALERNTNALALCPLGAAHPLLRVFAEPKTSPGLDVDALDQWLNDYARGIEFDIPVLLESCALLRGVQWCHEDEDDTALLKRVTHGRDWLLGCDHIYVDDASVDGLGLAVADLPVAQFRALAEPHAQLTWRHALSELDARAEPPPHRMDCLPVQLHVAHSWGGGLGRWIEDYIAADTHHNNLVLRPLGDWEGFGKTIALYRGADIDVPLRSWTLTTPVVSIVTGSAEYARLLAELVTEFRVESLLISSLIGTSLDILRTGLPTACVAHDFFPYCPALVATFESPCNRCDSSRQRQCRAESPHHRFFLHDDDDHWDRIREVFCDYFASPGIRMVVPSESVAQRYRELVPGCADRKVQVIPHGLGPELSQQLQVVRDAELVPQERLKVVVLGSLASQKGVEILAEIMGPLTEFADLFLIGCGDEGKQFEGRKHVVVIPRYTREELPLHLINANTDVGLLLSVVPETFSYTLSEFWAAGIPVVATRLGAFADRVRDGENGWLVDPTPQGAFVLLQQLGLDRDRIAQVRYQLLNSTVRSTGEMVDDYAAGEPQAELPPIVRFPLSRRSYRNAYRDYDHLRAIHINHKATYPKILLEFLAYSRQKVVAKQGAREWQRRPLLWLLDRCIGWLQRR